MTTRRICFTLNNPTQGLEEFCNEFEERYKPRYLIVQKEQGEQGTPHFQGYAEFAKSCRFAPIASHFHMHCETAKGDEAANTHYCSKPVEGCECQHCSPPPVRLDGPVIRGSTLSSGRGKRTDLVAAREAHREGGMKRLADEHLEVFLKYHRAFDRLETLERPPRPTMEVSLYYGPPDGGKTFAAENACEPSWTTASDWSGSKYWFDGLRRDHASVVIDEFTGQVPLESILKLLNERSQLVPIKGGHTWMCQGVVYITSNIHPFYWYNWEGREPQYAALCRRIHRVYGFRNRRKFELERERFFQWRRPTVVVGGLDGPDVVEIDPYEMIPQIPVDIFNTQ